MSHPRFPYTRHRHATPPPTAPALECEHVSVRYPRADRLAIADINLRVAAGARVALVGHNGSGKSTLLKTAVGLLPLVAGRIFVHGSRPGGCCHRVAYLTQRSEVDWRFPMSVRRLVMTGRYVHLGWFARPGRDDREIVDRVMEQLEITDLANVGLGELSGGQQQRALLARAMAQEADMLLLDEPMNAVDARTRRIVRELLAKLAQAGKTIVVATHDEHEIQCDFDQVIHLENGREIHPPSSFATGNISADALGASA